MTTWLIRGPTCLRSTLMRSPLLMRRERRGGPPPRRGSTARRALCVHEHGIDRMARRHEQAIALDAAEAQIGGALRQRDEPDRLAVGVEDLHAVLLRVAHAPAAPEIAVDVAAEAVGGAARLGGDERAAVHELLAVDVIDADHARSDAR